MRVVDSPADFKQKLQEASQEAGAAFGNNAVFLERYIRRAKHVEIQIIGDQHGNIVHLYERDCSVQRRHQKVVEIAPAIGLPERSAGNLADAAVTLGQAADYYNAGTVEFLVDAETHEWYFIEVNPRVQVEHTVTEVITGIDIVRTQILIAQGPSLHRPGDQPACAGADSAARDALQCRVTTEDPANNFIPDYGKISTYRSPAGFGIRLDGSFGLWRRGDLAVLRFVAREGDGLGQQLPASLPSHGPGPARVSHPRRQDEHSVPRKRGETSDVPSRAQPPRRFWTKHPRCSSFKQRATERRSCSAIWPT